VTAVLLILVVVLLVVVAVAFLLRRRFLLSGLGAVTMWLRPAGSPRWSLGVAIYGGDARRWYRALSISVRPQHRLCRAELTVDARRRAEAADLELPGDAVVLTCGTDEGSRELAMDPAVVTGFLSWVESAPPVR
jgi:hypothetical protein